MSNTARPRKKLIEVALPLPDINDASAYDKMPGIGPHPKGIHHWWARLPLPVSRAVLFASVVDDPSSNPEEFPTEAAQTEERERLFGIVRRMMLKQLHKHPEVYAEARSEMLRHCNGTLPTVLDPFAGGGSIPLEATRLGLEAHAGDLNPVCVLLNKCTLELAPRWAVSPPVNPKDRMKIGGTDRWRGTTGLAADVRHYGRAVFEAVRRKVGHLYPRATVTPEMAAEQRNLSSYVGKELPMVAWIWARTVASPNPAAQGAHVPLVSTFWLSSKKGAEVFLEPIVDRAAKAWSFRVRVGAPQNRVAIKDGTKSGRAQFRCLLTDDPIDDAHIKAEGKAGRRQARLLAVVADGLRGRVYLPATREQEVIAAEPTPTWTPEGEVPEKLTGGTCVPYGLKNWSDLFTSRQLTTMVALSDAIREIRHNVESDAVAAGLSEANAKAYGSTVMTFLSLALDRCADFNNSLCRWSSSNQKVMNLFGRQAIPMVWDFAEANLLGESVGAWQTCSEYVADCIEVVGVGPAAPGHSRQIDAATPWDGLSNVLVSTDPPYYDNISYAALSDFFYVWLRRTVGEAYSDVFSTVLVPKTPELTAAPGRFDGSKQQAKEHFEAGFRRVFAVLRDKMDSRFPLTVYYAFKQDDEENNEGAQETEGNGAIINRTTGWETMLDALSGTGFQITATWPVRASQKWRMVSMGTNALASYIVLACRPRLQDAPQTDRRSFLAELQRDLPAALKHLQQGNIAPVDFAQAAIGPGMAIYSRYSRILEASGKPMTVRAALALINQTLTEVLSQHEDEFDNETCWAMAWFEQNGFGEADFGEAELLTKAKVTSVEALYRAGIIDRGRGKVRLLRPSQLPVGWDPAEDRATAWEIVHHFIRVLEASGEPAVAALANKVGSKADAARELAYSLYTVCERKKRAQEALSYNGLVQSWPEITRLARDGGKSQPSQTQFFNQE